MNADFRRRIAKLERAAALAGTSERFWMALTAPWPPPGLTDAELERLAPLFAPPDDEPDPVEQEVAAMEEAATHQAHLRRLGNEGECPPL